MLLTAAPAHDGDVEAARTFADRLLAAHPRSGLSAARPWPFADPESWERVIASLRQAGVPEYNGE